MNKKYLLSGIFAVLLMIKPIQTFAIEVIDVRNDELITASVQGIPIEETFIDSGVIGFVSQYDHDKNGYLSSLEVSQIQYIYIVNGDNPIDLTGVSKLTSVTSVYIGRPVIEASELEKMNQVEDITIRVDLLNKLDLSQNTALKSLTIINYENFDASKMNLTQNSKLEVLKIDNRGEMGIFNLDISENKELLQLYFDNYGTSSVDISKLNLEQHSKLTDLQIKNAISQTTLNLAGNSQLKSLILQESSIPELVMPKSSQLEFVSIDRMVNQIEYLDLSSTINLKSLFINGRVNNISISDNINYKLEDGVLYNNHTEKLEVHTDLTKSLDLYLLENKRAEFSVPQEVTEVSSRAFAQNDTLNKVEFSENTPKLNSHVFYETSGIDIYFKGGLNIDNLEQGAMFLTEIFAGYQGTVYYPIGNIEWIKIIEEYEEYIQTNEYASMITKKGEHYRSNVTWESWDASKKIWDDNLTIINLQATSNGENKVKLTWSAARSADGYLIYGQKAGTYGYVGMTEGSTTFTDYKALANEYNFYWVFAYEKDAFNKMIPGPASEYVYAKGITPAVTNLRAVSVKNGVKLTWLPSSDADGYLMYGIRPGSKYEYVGMTTRGTNFTDIKASNEAYNFYWVYPYHKDNQGNMIIGNTTKYTYGRAL